MNSAIRDCATRTVDKTNRSRSAGKMARTSPHRLQSFAPPPHTHILRDFVNQYLSLLSVALTHISGLILFNRLLQRQPATLQLSFLFILFTVEAAMRTKHILCSRKKVLYLNVFCCYAQFGDCCMFHLILDFTVTPCVIIDPCALSYSCFGVVNFQCHKYLMSTSLIR